MKRIVSALLILMFALGFLPKQAKAQGYKPTAVIEIQEGQPQFVIDGCKFDFASGSSPLYKNSVFFVPIRGIVEALGGEVQWDSKERKINLNIGESQIVLFIGKIIAYVNGKSSALEEAPFIQSSRTLIPINIFRDYLNGILEIRDNRYVLTIEKPLTQVIDATGRKVLVPKKIYKIVSLYPMLSQLLFTVKSEQFLVASAKGSVINEENFARVFPKAKDLPDASSFKDPNVETIISFKPDLVITTYNTPIKKLEEANIPAVLLNLESPELMVKSIQFLGNILHRQTDAYNSLIYINKKLKNIQDITSKIKNKKTVYFAGANLFMTFGGDFYQTYLSEIAGTVSVSKDLIGGKVNVSPEQLLAWNPDYIILTSYTLSSKNEILSDPRLKDLKAVISGNIYRMPSFILAYDLPSPESILGIIWLSNKIYPDFVDFSFEKETVDFYKTIYGFDISLSEIKAILGEK